MATEFINTLKVSGGDYSIPSAWEAATQCNFTLSTTKVFSHSGITGAIADAATVTGQTSGATGSVVGFTTENQILLEGISGTFQSGEVMQVSAGNSVTISNDGDSAAGILEGYAGSYPNASIDLSGSITSAENYMEFRNAPNESHNLGLSGGVIINGSTVAGNVWQISQDHTKISGINFIMAGSITVTSIVIIRTGTGRYFRNCIVQKNNPGAGTGIAIYIGSGTGTYIENNLIIDVDATGAGVGRGINSQLTATLACSNNTVIGFEHGFRFSINNNTRIQNCVAAGQSGDCYIDQLTQLGGNNAASDFTAVGADPIPEISMLDDVDFVSPSTGDYRPAAGGKLAGAGLNLTASEGFSDDITGASRN